jgi:tRNA(Arg) A34 adenosine deaminase TadA
MHEEFMRAALEEAKIARDEGEVPVGAVIVCDGEIIASAHNEREMQLDPTAHAEVSAIRAACLKLGTFNLEGCVIYTSCEPCPMCLGAIYWAHLDKIYYGADQHDAAAVDFDDSFIYRELELKPGNRNKPVENILHDEAQAPFDEWRAKSDKIEY